MRFVSRTIVVRTAADHLHRGANAKTAKFAGLPKYLVNKRDKSDTQARRVVLGILKTITLPAHASITLH